MLRCPPRADDDFGGSPYLLIRRDYAGVRAGNKVRRRTSTKATVKTLHTRILLGFHVVTHDVKKKLEWFGCQVTFGFWAGEPLGVRPTRKL